MGFDGNNIKGIEKFDRFITCKNTYNCSIHNTEVLKVTLGSKL
jgi:hypothetical protein